MHSNHTYNSVDKRVQHIQFQGSSRRDGCGEGGGEGERREIWGGVRGREAGRERREVEIHRREDEGEREREREQWRETDIMHPLIWVEK